MNKIRLGKILIGFVIPAVLIGYLAAGFLMGRKPPLPQVASANGQPMGHVTVSMVADLMQSQLDGLGGWLPNDLVGSPGYFLDNLPNFQMGVLQTVRHTSRVVRDNLSRQRTSDAVHQQTDLAYSSFANDPRRWVFPSAEGAFKRGIAALVQFRSELGGGANIYPRADNLIELLNIYISELGTVSTHLLEAQESDKVGWLEVDDNFYYAQGVAHAMYGIMIAVQRDFQQVLSDKNATDITGLILQSLRASQFDPWFITNGSKDGFLANHSNNLKVFLDDVRQKMKSLVSILDQG